MGELGINPTGLITQVVSFVILFIVLSKLLYKPLVGMLDQRAEKIKSGLEAAENSRREAAKAEESIQNQLSEARIEGQKLISQARDTADQYREEEMVKVREDMKIERERALANIEREKETTVQEIRKEFAGLAITAAEQIVRSSLDEKEHERLIQNVLEESSSEKE